MSIIVFAPVVNGQNYLDFTEALPFVQNVTLNPDYWRWIDSFGIVQPIASAQIIDGGGPMVLRANMNSTNGDAGKILYLGGDKMLNASAGYVVDAFMFDVPAE